MRSLAEMLAMPTKPTKRRTGRPRHDEDAESRRKHIAVAVDKVIRGLPLGQVCDIHGVSHQTVYHYVQYALAYEDPVSEILRRVVAGRKAS